MTSAEIRSLVREEVTRQVNARMDGVDEALKAVTESNQAIERALAKIGPAMQALQRSNAAIVRVLHERGTG